MYNSYNCVKLLQVNEWIIPNQKLVVAQDECTITE